jgi:tellurite resistance protein TerC
VDAREKTHFSSAPKPTFPLLGGADLPEWAWIVFAVVFGVLLTVDLIVHRAGRRESRRRAVVWSVTWVATGIGFWGFVWAISDANTANEYLAVYAIEKSLSLDNLFVFLMVFQALQIPQRHQRTALSWGIFGALVFRAILIFAGVRAVERWSFLEYVFGVFLLYAAWHALREDPLRKKAG